MSQSKFELEPQCPSQATESLPVTVEQHQGITSVVPVLWMKNWRIQLEAAGRADLVSQPTAVGMLPFDRTIYSGGTAIKPQNPHG